MARPRSSSAAQGGSIQQPVREHGATLTAPSAVSSTQRSAPETHRVFRARGVVDVVADLICGGVHVGVDGDDVRARPDRVEELHLQCEKVSKHGGAGVLFAIFFFRTKKTKEPGKPLPLLLWQAVINCNQY